MTENTPFYSESYTIRAAEVNEQGKTTPATLCSLFQEIAGNHALSLSFDITDLKEKNLTWVLHRMDIQIKRYPEWRETITIESWPAAGDALRAYRDYRVLDQENNEIACGLSYWMMINLESRRPVRMPKEVLELGLQEKEHVLPVKNDRIKPLDQVDSEKTLQVRRADLDMNNHANNVRYVEWITEVLKPEQLHNIRSIDIMFLRESNYEDRMRSQLKQSDDSTTLHQLKNQGDQITALAKIKYF